jgi:hypothetical protein
MAEDTAEGLKDTIRVDTAELRGHVDAVVRSSVEETLNALLQAEADQICRQDATSARQSGSIRGRDITSASWRPKPARWC